MSARCANRWASVSVVLLGLVCACAGPSSEHDRNTASETTESERRGSADALTVQRTTNELLALSAGRYYSGDGLGFNVSVELDGADGFRAKSSSCVGMPVERTGRVFVRDGWLEFEPDGGAWGSQTLEAVLAGQVSLVEWGERRYLIQARRLVGFAQACHGESEPRDTIHGGELLRVGDEAKPASGEPQGQGDLAKLVFEVPLEARVIEVLPASETPPESDRPACTFVRVDVGFEQGAYVGLILYPLEPRDWRGLELAEVGPRASLARQEWAGGVPLEVGRRLGSHLYHGARKR